MSRRGPSQDSTISWQVRRRDCHYLCFLDRAMYALHVLAKAVVEERTAGASVGLHGAMACGEARNLIEV